MKVKWILLIKNKEINSINSLKFTFFQKKKKERGLNPNFKNEACEEQQRDSPNRGLYSFCKSRNSLSASSTYIYTHIFVLILCCLRTSSFFWLLEELNLSMGRQ